MGIKNYNSLIYFSGGLLLLIAAFAFTVSCNNNDGKIPANVVHNPISASGEQDLDELPEITFNETLHDFGTVIEGEKVIYNFTFTNTGKTDLILSSVSASCGCTATKYTNDPVAPGDEGIVTVTFDSRNRRGFQNKSVTIIANTQPNKTMLRIKAKVVSPSEL